MKAKITLMGNTFTNEMIEELNEQTDDCQYFLSKQKDMFIPPEFIAIVIELLHNLSYSATYDILKMILLSIISKLSFKYKKESAEKETDIIIIYNNNKIEFKTSFELSESQKDKVIDAAIKKMLE